MAIVAGNFLSKTATELQCRVLLIPWVKKKSVIMCSKSKDYSSSVPVRYIPNKSAKTEKLQASSPVDGLEDRKEITMTDLKVSRVEFPSGGKSLWRNSKSQYQNQNQNQMPVSNLTFDFKSEVEKEVNHDLEGGDYDFMEEPEEIVKELESFQEKHHNAVVGIQAGKSKQDVEKMAVELLATSRAFTSVELRKKLLRKKFPLDTVDAVIDDFESRGLINDFLYAETFSRSRWSSSSWGPRRIKQALFKKGVSRVDAEKAIKLVFEDGEAEDQESRLRMSKLSMEHLFVQALKQWQRGCDVPKETRKSRIIRWLQYRGFDWSIIGLVLKKLESEYPP
ncbi:unnamed protein product [Ilex paraguariensis]|uniref:Regulatory protein RecX n=1 Tax=Ilex paraguariensis TaxID=185542 RepID=A0ABC8RKW9_9AQUA